MFQWLKIKRTTNIIVRDHSLGKRIRKNRAPFYPSTISIVRKRFNWIFRDRTEFSQANRTFWPEIQLDQNGIRDQNRWRVIVNRLVHRISIRVLLIHRRLYVFCFAKCSRLGKVLHCDSAARWRFCSVNTRIRATHFDSISPAPLQKTGQIFFVQSNIISLRTLSEDKF